MEQVLAAEIQSPVKDRRWPSPQTGMGQKYTSKASDLQSISVRVQE